MLLRKRTGSSEEVAMAIAGVEWFCFCALREEETILFLKCGAKRGGGEERVEEEGEGREEGELGDSEQVEEEDLNLADEDLREEEEEGGSEIRGERAEQEIEGEREEFSIILINLSTSFLNI